MRSRAHDALDTLGPGAGGLPAERRREIADWLLGQQSPDAAVATRAFVDGSPAGRTWAHGVARELEPLAGDRLPELPAEQAADAHTRGPSRRPSPRPPPSPPPPPPRRACRAVAARCSSAACSRPSRSPSCSSSSSPAAATSKADSTATQAADTTSTAAQPQVRAQINLTPPKNAPAKKALGHRPDRRRQRPDGDQRRLPGPADLQQEGRLRDLGLHEPVAGQAGGRLRQEGRQGPPRLPGRDAQRA